jgi:glycosyltransferase involved in cell wall biosynthesis
MMTYPGAFLHRGGGEREIHLLHEALNSAGVLADIYGPSSQPIHAYQDIIYFSMTGGSELLLDEVAKGGRHRLILWPNLWFIEQPADSHVNHMSHLLARFDAVVFKSHAEEAHFRSHFDLVGKDVIRITPLISSRFLRRDVSTVFKESYGLERYALWTGIIEPQKNQLTAIRAFGQLDMDLVISGEVRDAAYAEECRRQAGPNIHFIPAMPFASELHISALAHCRLYVELPLDFPGASAIEAAAIGCELILSESAWTEEFLGGRCVQVEPLDPIGVRAAISKALEGGARRSGMTPMQTMEQAIAPLVTYLLSEL